MVEHLNQCEEHMANQLKSLSEYKMDIALKAGDTSLCVCVGGGGGGGGCKMAMWNSGAGCCQVFP